MVPVTAKLERAEQALTRLREILHREGPADIIRDSAILRFTLSVETAWKAARALVIELRGVERLTSASPKAIARECLIAGWLTEAETEMVIDILNDRNITVHVYAETKADELFSRLPSHVTYLDLWLKALRAALSER